MSLRIIPVLEILGLSAPKTVTMRTTAFEA